MKKNQILLFRIIGVVLLLIQYNFIESSVPTYTINTSIDYNKNPAQPAYKGEFQKMVMINVITRDGHTVPLIWDGKFNNGQPGFGLGNVLLNLTTVAQNNSNITVFVNNNSNNNSISLRHYNDNTSPAIATFMMAAPLHKDYIAWIQWDAQTSNGIAGGAINIYDKASIAGQSSFTVQLIGAISVLISQQKGCQVYDIYMKNAPRVMTVDKTNVDLSGYEYDDSLSGTNGKYDPTFKFAATSCSQENGFNGCTNCHVQQGFKIDGHTITLLNLPSFDEYAYTMIIRIHVGLVPPATAPPLP